MDKIEANDYNLIMWPKRNGSIVSKHQMRWLHHANCLFYDQSRENMLSWMDFRYTIMLRYKNIFERENGMLPVSVIEKTSVIEWHPPFDTTAREKTRGGTTSFTSRNVKIRLGRNQDYERAWNDSRGSAINWT
jgi:hypothetical protein